jgi:hypothetical protein
VTQQPVEVPPSKDPAPANAPVNGVGPIGEEEHILALAPNGVDNHVASFKENSETEAKEHQLKVNTSCNCFINYVA